MSRRQKPERERCFYCGDQVLAGRVERDHFPKPACAGGTQTVPACPQCHDLKDRTSWDDMPLEMKAEFMEEFMKMGRAAKIVFAQFMCVSFEASVARKVVPQVTIAPQPMPEPTEVKPEYCPLAEAELELLRETLRARAAQR